MPNIKDNPCNSSFLHTVLQGLKRLLAKPVVKKEPITPGILRALVDKYGSSNNLMDLRLCTMTLIAFAGFLRHDELIHICRRDLQLHESHVNIFISKSKTDIYRQGAWVLIAQSTCYAGILKQRNWMMRRTKVFYSDPYKLYEVTGQTYSETL